MTADSVWQIARYILIAIGSFVTAKGWADESTITSLVSAIGTIFVAVWGLVVRAKDNKAS
jgi:hypothetical protein